MYYKNMEISLWEMEKAECFMSNKIPLVMDNRSLKANYNFLSQIMSNFGKSDMFRNMCVML